MAHGARHSAGNALEVVAGHQHHRHTAVAARPTEVRGQIGCGLEVCLPRHTF